MTFSFLYLLLLLFLVGFFFMNEKTTIFNAPLNCCLYFDQSLIENTDKRNNING